MVFYCENDIFNYIRLFGICGVPERWVKNSKLLFEVGELNRVYDKTVKYIEECA